MRIKTKTGYENILIYYVIIVVNLLHVSVTFFTIFRGYFFEGYNK